MFKEAVMKRVIFLVPVLAAVLCFADEPAEKVLREWGHKDTGAMDAVFIRKEGKYVICSNAQGETLQLPLWKINSKDLAYVQRMICSLPDPRPLPEHLPREPALLVNLDAESLPDGRLKEWNNTGILNGSFLPLNMSPVVGTVDGRKAVSFDYGPWALPMEFQPMVSDFTLPAGLGDEEGFTVVAWVYNPGAIGHRETFMAWQTLSGDEGYQFGYGEEGRYPHERLANAGAFNSPFGGAGFGNEHFPEGSRWYQVAYTFTGGKDGKFKLYLDGTNLVSKQFKRMITVQPTEQVTTTSAVFCAGLYTRDNSPMNVWLYLGERDNHLWRTQHLRKREWRWSHIINLGTQQPGRVTATIDSLKPGTKYYYRFYGIAPDEQRWSDRAGMVVTAGKDGTPAQTEFPREQKRIFLGSHWGSRWDWTVKPLHWYSGSIASLQVYTGVLPEEKIQAQYAATAAKYMVPDEKREEPRYVEEEPVAEQPITNRYFTPEFDGLVSESIPAGITHDGFLGKFMEAEGQHVVTSPDCPDEALRIARKSCQKVMEKRPDLFKTLAAYKCAITLGYARDTRGTRFDMTGQAYGTAINMLADPTFYWGQIMIVHEMGHQFHMYGAVPMEEDFQFRLTEVYNKNMEDLKWLGDYGANNIYEYMAVTASAYCNDGHKDDVVYPREALRCKDPLFYYFLKDYYPGDKRISLDAARGVTAAADGSVSNWLNSGGVEYWGKFGWKKYRGTVGTFIAVGSPKLTTVGGVTAIAFDGDDALKWNYRTRDGMIENKEWSVEIWAYKPAAADKDEVMVSWGRKGAGPAFLWGKHSAGYDLDDNRPGECRYPMIPGVWHHIVYVFEGGGLSNAAGKLDVYIDGKLRQTRRHKLDIPGNAKIMVGAAESGNGIFGGFHGALALVNIYDYDLSKHQVERYYARSKDYFTREDLAVAGSLLIDLDARMPAPRDDDTRVLYPESLDKPWLRSWNNRGVLGGKFFNDVHTNSQSAPLLETVDGIKTVVFDGKDRMVGVMNAKMPLAGMNDWTLEAWGYTGGIDIPGTAFQWGSVLLAGEQPVEAGWKYVVMTCKDGYMDIHLNGIPVGPPPYVPGTSFSGYPHLGVAWSGSGWQGFFDGSLAQVRLHSGVLTEEQIQHNYRESDLRKASSPVPPDGSAIAIARKEPLVWFPGVGSLNKSYDVYIGTDRQAVARADRKSTEYKGTHIPGKYNPDLEPATKYYWRVDELDAEGNPGIKGRVWSFDTYTGVLVDLTAESLVEGDLGAWTNTGYAGGQFLPGKPPEKILPVVSMADGRKGISFNETDGIRSSFTAPAGITGTSDFTLSVWVLQKESSEVAPVAGWATFSRRGRGGSAMFSCGSSPQYGAVIGGRNASCGFMGGVPPAGSWHHIVYAYEGGTNGTFRIYADGELNTVTQLAWNARAGGNIQLGMPGMRRMQFTGLLSDVFIYDYALSAEEVQHLFNGGGYAPDKGECLVALAAADLPDGNLQTWKNTGSLGGYFGEEVKASVPRVEQVAERKAVTFSGDGSYLASDILTPEMVTFDKPFTVVLDVYNPQAGRNETAFALAPHVMMKPANTGRRRGRGGDLRRAANCNVGRGTAFSSGHRYRDVSWEEGKEPSAGEWHRVTWVYPGGERTKFKVYVDGIPAGSLDFYALCTVPGYPMHIGAAYNTVSGPLNFFSGSISGLKVYDYAKTDEEIKSEP
jgi:hypothetical protein